MIPNKKRNNRQPRCNSFEQFFIYLVIKCKYFIDYCIITCRHSHKGQIRNNEALLQWQLSNSKQFISVRLLGRQKWTFSEILLVCHTHNFSTFMTILSQFCYIILNLTHYTEAQSIWTTFVFVFAFCLQTIYFSKWKRKLFECSELPYHKAFSCDRFS